MRGYVGPAATILESGASLAPGSPIEDGELTDREVEFFEEQGWLTPEETPPKSAKASE